jgi:hypothetical protein
MERPPYWLLPLLLFVIPQESAVVLAVAVALAVVLAVAVAVAVVLR